ncbi:MAG: TetR/AcrR family transcriptional regulator, partial [Solirubrobacteraceae bacterium]
MPSRQRNNARDDILRVFAEMVARNGYAETSIGDVAAALGLSKGTVVYHFNSKLELLEEVHLAYIRRGLAQAHHVLASLPTNRVHRSSVSGRATRSNTSSCSISQSARVRAASASGSRPASTRR